MTTLPQDSPRLTEIKGWLQRQVTLDEAMAEIAVLDNLPDTRTTLSRTLNAVLTIVTGLWLFDLYWWLKDRPRLPVATQFSQWVEQNMQPGDHLWRYDTGSDSWEMLAGECGFVIIRNGNVHDFWMHLEN